MAITVTRPMSAPTGLSATLVAGGTLAASTTYYYVVFAYDNTTFTPSSISKFAFHSDLSAEGSFTTDATNKSALIKWTNSAEHNSDTRYQILISTTSGNYVGAKTYTTTTTESTGTITNGTTGYTVTNTGTGVQIMHSAQMANPNVFGIAKNLGNIAVDIDTGSLSNPCQSIYNAIVIAGFGSYVYYDGWNFCLKGWLRTSAGLGTGTATFERKNLVFLTGGVHCGGDAYILRFGRWTSDNVGANYSYGCNLDFQGYRYKLRANIAGVLQVYGCRVSAGDSRINLVSESPLSSGYWNTIANDIMYYADEIRDSIVAQGYRGVTSEIYDSKFGISNNFFNKDIHRCKFSEVQTLAYYAGAKQYDCNWTVGSTTSRSVKHYVPATGNTYYTDFYNCIFSHYSDNIPDYTFNTTYGKVTSDSYMQQNYSLNLSILDENGDPLEGASANLVDQYGNPALWIEHDDDLNAKVTGNEYTTARTSDENGLINTYYVKSYVVNLAPDNTIANSYCNNVVFKIYYPFTLTITADGYETQEVILETLTNKKNLIIQMKPQVPIRISTEGPVLALAPETGSSSLLKKL